MHIGSKIGIPRPAHRAAGGGVSFIDEVIAGAGASLHTFFDGSRTTTNGSGRFRWTDLSENGRHADSGSAAQDPSVTAVSSLSGRAGVRFDLVERLTSVAPNSDYDGLLTGSQYAVCVYNASVPGSDDRYLFQAGATTDVASQNVSALNTSIETIRVGAGTTQVDVTVENSQRHSGLFGTLISSHAPNEQTVGTIANEAGTLDGPLVVGNRPDGARPLSGEIVAFIVLDSPTADQVAAVEWAINKHCLGLSGVRAIPGLAAWYSADVGVTGDPATAVSDQSGWGNDLVAGAAGGPEINPSWRNGQPSFDIRTTSAGLTMGALAQGQLTQPNSTYFAASWAQTPLNIGFLNDYALVAPRQATRIFNERLAQFAGTANASAGNVITPGTDLLIVSRFNGASSEIFGALEGGTVEGGSTPTAGTDGAGSIGLFSVAGNGFGNVFDGQMGEAIFFDRILTTSEEDIVRNYLSSKFAIPWASGI